MQKDFGKEAKAIYKGSPSKYLSLDFLQGIKRERYCSYDNNGNLKEYCPEEVDDLINQKANAQAEKFAALADDMEQTGRDQFGNSFIRHDGDLPHGGGSMKKEKLRNAKETEREMFKRLGIVTHKKAMAGLIKATREFGNLVYGRGKYTIVEHPEKKFNKKLLA